MVANIIKDHAKNSCAFNFTSPHFYARTNCPLFEKFTVFISVDFLYPFSVELVFCE